MFRPHPRFIDIKPSQRFMFALVTLCLVSFATPSFATEQVEAAVEETQPTEDRRHAISGTLMSLPTPSFATEQVEEAVPNPSVATEQVEAAVPTPSFATEQVVAAVQETQPTKERRHVISGTVMSLPLLVYDPIIIIPFLAWNEVSLAYEYEVTDRLGIRVDLGARLVLLDDGFLFGSVGVSYRPLETTIRDARHSLELAVMPTLYRRGEIGSYDIGPSQSEIDAANRAGEEIDFGGPRSGPVTGLAIKTIVGYRYQQHTGFQLRVGVAPLINVVADKEGDYSNSKGLELLHPAPEISLGWAF
ncbi:MAG: hypothetical protein VYE15_02950 [Myxococcota bacterium]|nr:hypothetical protein [Myxococcota bacterium]